MSEYSLKEFALKNRFGAERENKITEDVKVKLIEIMGSKTTGQFLRYLVTGGSAFVLEYVLYMILYRWAGLDYALSMVIVYSMLFAITFIVTRKWTFRSEANAKKQLFLYFLLFLFNVFVGNYLMMRILVGAGMPAEFAPFIKTVLITTWNFLIYKYIIYK